MYFSKILWVKGGSLGDFILSLPTLMSLRARYPDSYIEIYAPYDFKPLLYPSFSSSLSSDVNNEVLVQNNIVDSFSDLYGGRWQNFLKKISELNTDLEYSDWDLVVLLRPDIDNLFSKYFSSRKNCVFLHNDCLLNPTEHITKSLSSVLSNIGINLLKNELPDYIPPKKRATDSIDNLFIHPGSGGRQKCLPLSFYEDIAKLALGSGMNVTVLFGHVEVDYGIDKEWRLKGVRKIVNEPLPYIKEVLSSAGLFLGNDSGITHLAAGLGIPVVSLFLSTNPMIWAPVGSYVRVFDIKNNYFGEFCEYNFSFNKKTVNFSVENVFNCLLDMIKDLKDIS